MLFLLSQAIAALGWALQADPTNAEVLLSLGVSHTNELDQAQALTYLHTWMTTHKQHSQAAASVPAPGDSSQRLSYVIREFEAAAAQVNSTWGYSQSRLTDTAIISNSCGVLEYTAMKSNTCKVLVNTAIISNPCGVLEYTAMKSNSCKVLEYAAMKRHSCQVLEYTAIVSKSCKVVGGYTAARQNSACETAGSLIASPRDDLSDAAGQSSTLMILLPVHGRAITRKKRMLQTKTCFCLFLWLPAHDYIIAFRHCMPSVCCTWCYKENCISFVHQCHSG